MAILEASDSYVRSAVVKAINRLPKEVQVQLAPSMLANSGDCVRIAAVRAISKLPEEVQVQLAPKMVAMLEDSDCYVRAAAVEAVQAQAEQMTEQEALQQQLIAAEAQIVQTGQAAAAAQTELAEVEVLAQAE